MKTTKQDNAEKESKTVVLYFTGGYFVHWNDGTGYGRVIEV